MGMKFYGTKLSENMTRTPAGFLVCKNAVIGRTGFQVYKGAEIDVKEKAGLDIEIDDAADVKIYRSEIEVFKPASIASFQGATFTCTHPEKLLTVETNNDHDCGDVTNVRKGTEPLEDGNWPLVADIIIKDKDTIFQVEVMGVRELSCGYNYHLALIDGNIYQIDIIGNHVALVGKGRAGSAARLNDAAPNSTEKVNTMSLRKKILALGFKAFAADAKPEDLAAAMDEMSSEEYKPEPKAEDRTPVANVDRAAASADSKVTDAKAKDARKSMHDALDRRMDAMEAEQAAQGASETEDDEALSSLFGASGAAKSKETEGLDSVGDDGEEAEADNNEGEEAEADDEAVQSVASPVIPEGDRSENVLPSATDSAEAIYQRGIVNGRREALRNLRPIVARSKDTRVRGAFDTALKTITAKPTGKSSYLEVMKAAKAPSAAAMDSVNAGEKAVEDAQAAYADMRGKNVTKK